MELTPFNPSWADSGNKLDLRGIYRRPGSGVSLTSPLPIRRHNDWQNKGFTFVSLATGEDVNLAQGFLMASGVDMKALRQSYGPPPQMAFRVDLYLKECAATDAEALAELQAKVDKYGAEAVIDMMRTTDPHYALPPAIKVPATTDAAKGKK